MLKTLNNVKELLEAEKARLENSEHSGLYKHEIFTITVLLDCVSNEITRQEAK